MALQGGKDAPFELIEMQLCREFHCLPDELERQDFAKMELFIEMMNLESQYRDRDDRLARQKLKKRFPG